MIDPCALPETGWGWFSLALIALALVGLGVSAVLLPRRAWAGMVGALALVLGTVGASKPAEAQSAEECYSIKVVNMGSAYADNLDPNAFYPNLGMTIVCEWDANYAPVVAPAGVVGGPSENCVQFPEGTASGTYKYLRLSSALSAVVAVQSVTNVYTGIALYGSEPSADNASDHTNSEVFFDTCGSTTGFTYAYQIGNGDTAWVTTNRTC